MMNLRNLHSHPLLRKSLLSLIFALCLSPSLLAQQADSQTWAKLRSTVVSNAMKYINTPYKYGGITPAGFDCSGFINFLYGPYVSNLPRRSQDFVRYGKKVDYKDLKPGDLLLFATTPGSDKITHVSLYIGKGKVIHAISDGKLTGIQISDASQGYWNKALRYARRILPD